MINTCLGVHVVPSALACSSDHTVRCPLVGNTSVLVQIGVGQVIQGWDEGALRNLPTQEHAVVSAAQLHGCGVVSLLQQGMGGRSAPRARYLWC